MKPKQKLQLEDMKMHYKKEFWRVFNISHNIDILFKHIGL